MPIAAECGACHKRFKANEKLAGKRVKCPQCGGVIQVPAPQPRKQAAPAPASLLDEEGVPTSSAPARPSIPRTPSAPVAPSAPAQTAGQCPSCGSALMDNAVLCVLCGYDLRSGQKVDTGLPSEVETPASVTLASSRKRWEEQAEKEKKKGKKSQRRELPQAVAFLRGCAVAFGTTMLGVFIWWAVAYFTWMESVYIALLLGGLTGMGMMIGYGHEDVLPGIAAAIIAFVGIIIAKVLIFVTIFVSLASQMADEMADLDFPEEGYAVEEMGDEEFVSEDAPAEDMGTYAETATDEGMPPGQTSAEETLDEESFGEGLAAEGEYDVELSEDYSDGGFGASVGGIGAAIFLLFIFGGFWNILIIIVACGVAYKVGSGGQWWED